MISDEMKAVVDLFMKQEDKMRLMKGASEEQITAFEKKNGIQLPSKFKEWLLISDGGEYFLPGGLQLYGVAHKPLIDVEDNDRPDDQYIVIGALSSGDPLLCEKTGERISIYNHGAGKIEEDEQYNDFYCFLKDLPNVFGIGG